MKNTGVLLNTCYHIKIISNRQPSIAAEGRQKAHPVPVALVGLDLGREATGVARGVGRAGLAADGREAHDGGRLVADLREDRRAAQVAHVVRDLEEAERARALGVHHLRPGKSQYECLIFSFVSGSTTHTLGDALAVKVREEVDVVEVCVRGEIRAQSIIAIGSETGTDPG